MRSFNFTRHHDIHGRDFLWYDQRDASKFWYKNSGALSSSSRWLRWKTAARGALTAAWSTQWLPDFLFHGSDDESCWTGRQKHTQQFKQSCQPRRQFSSTSFKKSILEAGVVPRLIFFDCLLNICSLTKMNPWISKVILMEQQKTWELSCCMLMADVQRMHRRRKVPDNEIEKLSRLSLFVFLFNLF